MKKDYVEFSLGRHHLQLTTESHWECRNEGFLKIMTRVFELLQEGGEIKDDHTIRINTADGPTKSPPKENCNFIEFDTSTRDINEAGVFPDYIFGNWWHIGLRNFDRFVQEIHENSDIEKINDNRLFWIGNLMGIRQRLDYIELCKKNPDKFFGREMTWTNSGTKPTFFVPTKEYCAYKYLLDLTGHGCSGRLKLLPFCRRPLFITDREFWSWSDMKIIKQNLHIQINKDLSDLIEKFNNTSQNEIFSFEKAFRLSEYCRSEFTFEKVCKYAAELVSKKIKAINSQKIDTQGTNLLKFDVVVSHYRENLSWVDRLDHKDINAIYVYTKGNESVSLKNPKVQTIILPNIGRESHTYLHHCYSHYDRMKQNNSPDFVFFVQGSPHGMEGERLYKSMKELSENIEMKFTSNFRVSSAYSFLNRGRCDSWQGQTSKSDYDIKEWCEKFIKNNVQIEKIPIFWNACFGVSADRILSNLKEKYKLLTQGELAELNPECGHYFERLWYYVFNMDDIGMPMTFQDCWEFWGGEQGSQRFYGLMKLNENGTIGMHDNFNECFWEDKGEKKLIMNKNREPTCLMERISEEKYSGEFTHNRKVIHTLMKFNTNFTS